MNVMDKALQVTTEQPASVPSPFSQPVFASDAPDAAPTAIEAGFLAELALLREVATPLCIGLVGPAGSGKSSLLRATAQAVGTLGRAAREAGIATPFAGAIAVVPVTVGPETDAATAIGTAVQTALTESHPRLVDEAAHADPDLHTTAEAARDRLDRLRQRLDGERQRLDELTARQARLADAVLFDTSGSQVDAFARANRGRIERSLRGFGFGGDRLLAFKELVRDRAEPGFGAGWLPAFWAFRGQTRLLVVAIGFLVLFWLIGLLIDSQGTLVGTLHDSNERLASVADWLGAHAGWLRPAREVAGLAALAALALNLVRGLRFIGPVARGARLLRSDIEGRRRDLDGLVAHQAQRVETLAQEAEQAGLHASTAESRLARAGSTPRPGGLMRSGTAPSPRAAAAAFLAAIGDALGRPRGDQTEAPDRIVVLLDGLERLASRDAAAALEACHGLLARPGIVTIVALDRAHAAAGFGETDPALAAASLDRIIQVPLAVGQHSDAAAMVRSLLAPPRPGDAAPLAVDAARSGLETPWLPGEASVLEALSPFAGATPRAVKRFVNVYRIARGHPIMATATAADHAALAIGLAAQAQGLPPARIADTPAADGLAAMRQAAETALGKPVEVPPLSPGLLVAERFSAY